MFKRLFHINQLIFLIPALYIIWGFYYNHLTGPIFLSRIDPELPYLLNGLNCAVLNFEQIGHVDHPGTPFQLLTGIFIRIIYWIFGQGSIIEDVINRPELYLSGASFLLSVLTAFVLFWLGKIVIKYRNDIIGLILLQSSVLIMSDIIGLPSRYIPDRLLLINVLIFSGLCIKLLYKENYSRHKFAIYSGFFLGMALVTKINFFPILIIPLFLLKRRKEFIYYALSTSITAIVFFLPVYNKFNYFWQFVKTLFTHDGLYGGGEAKIININNFWKNIQTIFAINEVFAILSISIVTTLVVLLFRPVFRRKYHREFSLLSAIFIASLVSILMVAKHYKNYYLVPVLGLSGLSLLLIWQLCKCYFSFKFIRVAFILIVPVFIFLTAKMIYPAYLSKPYKLNSKLAFHKLVKQHVGLDDYLLIEPSWMSGPLQSYGLVYGVSYVNQHHLYFREFEKFYSNVITWEGDSRPLKYFRMIDANLESILKSGRDIFLLSTSYRNAPSILIYLKSHANKLDIPIIIDTVFSNQERNQYFLKVCNNSNWNTLINTNCGFERTFAETLLTDDGTKSLKGNFQRADKKVYDGNFSLMLNKFNRMSPIWVIDNVEKEDYFEITIKKWVDNNQNNGALVITSYPDNKMVVVSETEPVSKINPNWEIIRINTSIYFQPENGKLAVYFKYEGEKNIVVDDLRVKHFRRTE